MQEFPHVYRVSARADASSDVELSAEGVEPIVSAPPVQFGGPGNRWSPEDLLVAAIADCFILTFRAIATHSKLEWHALDCDVSGVLDRVERVTRFTEFTVSAVLDLPEGADTVRAEQLLQKAEANCLVTNSLAAEVRLETEVRYGG